MKAAWPGRGWSRARAPSARRSPSCCRRPKGLQPAGNSRPKWSACRPPPSSVIAPVRPGCVSSSPVVEGPRVGLAARFAVALRDGDAAELSSVSEEFERMGDLVAAIDAAAHAALAYRSQDLRGSALTCSARGDALAEQCGGASTPALRQATRPLPLTDREAEIVMMIGEGLSNRAIAERLTVSVRTVESHIYRAMARTGTTSRDELAALIPPPEGANRLTSPWTACVRCRR